MQQALNFAQCVRSHGAPNYPDPNSSGVFVETPQNYTEFQLPGSAAAACNHLQPRKPVLSPAMQAKQFRANLALANCMHQHGYPNFPDSWGGGIHVDQFASLGIDVNSPQFNAAMKTCGWH